MINMIQQIQTAYTDHQGVKLTTLIALILCGVLLYWLSGGFPPWAWRLLAQTMLLMDQLWSQRGAAILTPLAGLVLLSLSLLIMWVSLTIAAIKVGIHCWQDFQGHQSLDQQWQEAEQMSDNYIYNTRTQPQQQKLPSRHTQEEVSPVHTPRSTAFRAQHHPYYDQEENHQPMQAAVPGSPRPTTHMPQARRVRYPSTLTTRREQLHLVPSPPKSEPGEAIATQLPHQPEIAIDQYPTLVPTTGQEIASTDLEITQTIGRISSKRLATEPEDEEDTSPSLLQENAQIRFAVGVGLDPGIVRRHAPNEDTLLAVQGTRTTDTGPEPAGLFIVADGMGGHAHGQEASRMAIQVLSDTVIPVLMRGSERDINFLELLREGAHRANLAIYQRNREQENMMGTTLTAALMVGNTAYIINVGDSRTYHYRKSEGLAPITRDHSVVARLVEKGAITSDEVYTHPKRNQIYRCLGDRATVDVDSFTISLYTGDVLLLCSDGLWEMVRDSDMQSIIETSLPHPIHISKHLTQAALDHGGADNISIIVVHVTASSA